MRKIYLLVPLWLVTQLAVAQTPSGKHRRRPMPDGASNAGATDTSTNTWITTGTNTWTDTSTSTWTDPNTNTWTDTSTTTTTSTSTWTDTSTNTFNNPFGNGMPTPTPGTSTPNPANGDSTPLVLSLTETDETAIFTSRHVKFDINGDGHVDALPWIRGDLAFLVWDRNGNGRIDSGAELFGDGFMISDDVHATNGFMALASLDSNHDGKIDPKDKAYAFLQLWFDRNENGVTDAGELMSLREARIESIALAHEFVTAEKNHSHIKWRGQFVRDNGKAGKATLPIWDVVFPYATLRGAP